MNRLVIIGNGFDLAHGLKSSYYNFLKQYLVNSVQKPLKRELYEDDLIIIEPNNRYSLTANAINSFNDPEITFHDLYEKIEEYKFDIK